MSRAAPLGAAAVLLLSGCGTDGRPDEADRLQSLAGLEEARLFTLEAGAAAGYPQARRRLAAQRERVRRLRAHLAEEGENAPMPFERTADVDTVLPGLGGVASAEDFARFSAELDAVARAARRRLSPAVP